MPQRCSSVGRAWLARPRCHRCVWIAAAALLLAGCHREPDIRRYQAPKVQNLGGQQSPSPPTPHGAVGSSDRMLAAVIPHGEQAWFFKVTGPQAAVAEQVTAFQSLIQSIKFVDGRPQWKLPAGWRERPGSGMRLATLELGSMDQPLELSVIRLGTMGMSDAAYVLSNVNRWRGQLQLPPITAEQLDAETQRVQLEGATATLVNLVGALQGGMGAAAGMPTGGGAATGGKTPPAGGSAPRQPVPQVESENQTRQSTER